MKQIIETKDLDFAFNGRDVLKNLELNVPEHSIYGFLGVNGAGKTTSIRILLNLIKSYSGSVYLFGKDIRKNRSDVLKKLGALVETPSIYKHLSAKDNLEIQCKYFGADRKNIDDILKIVGLEADKHRKVKEFSLGMTQRLGIGLALVNEPEVLILDEPVNGLDPLGMIEIRELIKLLNREYGKTIFISSHLLGEIDKMVTHIGLINEGSLYFQGTIDGFRRLNKPKIDVEVEDIEQAVSVIKKLSYSYERVNTCRIRIELEAYEQGASLLRDLIYHDVQVFEAKANKNEIEDLFIELTKKTTR